MNKLQFQELFDLGSEMIKKTAMQVIENNQKDDKEAMRVASILFQFWADMSIGLITTFKSDNPDLSEIEIIILDKIIEQQNIVKKNNTRKIFEA